MNLLINLLKRNKLTTSTTNMIRLLVICVVVLALVAGFYQTLYQAEKSKYLRLEDKYVRVRQELGTEETERLIQKSYQRN